VCVCVYIYQIKSFYCESLTDKRQLISVIEVSCGALLRRVPRVKH